MAGRPQRADEWIVGVAFIAKGVAPEVLHLFAGDVSMQTEITDCRYDDLSTAARAFVTRIEPFLGSTAHARAGTRAHLAFDEAGRCLIERSLYGGNLKIRMTSAQR